MHICKQRGAGMHPKQTELGIIRAPKEGAKLLPPASNKYFVGEQRTSLTLILALQWSDPSSGKRCKD